MPNPIDPETLKIPAYLRKKAIVSQARQKLILTALDRKEAGLSPHSKKALAPAKKIISRTPRKITSVAVSKTSRNEFERTVTPKKFQKIGTVTHYLDNIQVAIIQLASPLKVGDLILLESEDAIFFQTVEEMQIDRKPVTKAKRGAHIGLKSAYEATVNGSVYKFSL